MTRLASFVLFALMASHLFAQARNVTQTFVSIGAGPYEFPIAGEFSVRREGGATIFSEPKANRELTIGFFRNPTLSSSPENILKVEQLVRSNWVRFASQEKGQVVRTFARHDISTSVAVFSMASEYGHPGALQYYVQFAVTDGWQTVSLFVEGTGDAGSALTTFEPLIRQVKIVGIGGAK